MTISDNTIALVNTNLATWSEAKIAARNGAAIATLEVPLATSSEDAPLFLDAEQGPVLCYLTTARNAMVLMDAETGELIQQIDYALDTPEE
jgi:hypothetical protein